VFEKGKLIPIVAEKGKNKGKTVGYKQSYPNFKALVKPISEYIESILGEHSARAIEEEDDDSGENRSLQSMNIDKFDRASYEFSKLDSVNRRVKLFFATIPYSTFDENGRIVVDYSKNMFNTPSFAPIDEVYNVIVNDLHDVQNIQELDQQLYKLAKYHPIHRRIYIKYHKLISNIYTQDENGNTIVDYDKEAFAIQILNAIRSQKIDFIIARSNRDKATGNKSVRISTSSLERDAR